MPNYEVTSPTGKKYRVTAPDGASQDEVLAYAQKQFASLEAPPARFGMTSDASGRMMPAARDTPMEDRVPMGAPEAPAVEQPPEQANTWGNALKNVAQGAGHFATSITGGLAGDVAGLGALVGDIATFGKLGIDPAAVREKVASEGTYQPENPESMTMKIATAPGKVIAGSGEYLASKTDNPYAQDVLRAVPLAAASALGVKAAMPARIAAKTPALVNGRATTQSVRVPVPGKVALPKIEGASAQERAKNFVSSRTNLAWDSLSEAFRRRLTEVAATADNLERLDATAIERQGVLASLERPITNPTRGQLTRDPLQQRTEQLVKSTDAGAELRALDLEHNKALTDNLDLLRGRTGGKAAGDIQTGNSVQGALRSRFAKENANVRKLYDEAEEAGEMQGPVNIDKLVEHLKAHDDPAQVSYALNRLKQLGAITEETNGGITVSANTPLTLKQLEGIRRAAVAAGKNGGTAGHYASELKRVIDDVTDGAGGEKYKAARAARKAVGDEFERQAAVSRLVKNKEMSSDRATALEDTFHKTVVTGSLDDLKSVRASLEKAGDKGAQAWADLKSATIDFIKNRATGGKLGLKNEAGDLNATWAGLRRAVDDIGPDKLKEMFGEVDAKRLEALVEAAQLLKTEAPMGIKGSPTIDKLLTLLDRVGQVPGLGKASEVVGGAVKLGQKVGDIGKTGREIKKATTTPLDEVKRAPAAEEANTPRWLERYRELVKKGKEAKR